MISKNLICSFVLSVIFMFDCQALPSYGSTKYNEVFGNTCSNDVFYNSIDNNSIWKAELNARYCKYTGDFFNLNVLCSKLHTKGRYDLNSLLNTFNDNRSNNYSERYFVCHGIGRLNYNKIGLPCVYHNLFASSM